jgi:hypothetical protein
MARRRKVDLGYLVDKLIVEVVEKYTADCDVKEMTIKTADFINAIKVIADLKGLKVVPDNTFKGEQEVIIEISNE